MWNHHTLGTQSNMSPLQLWTTGHHSESHAAQNHVQACIMNHLMHMIVNCIQQDTGWLGVDWDVQIPEELRV